MNTNTNENYRKCEYIKQNYNILLEITSNLFKYDQELSIKCRKMTIILNLLESVKDVEKINTILLGNTQELENMFRLLQLIETKQKKDNLTNKEMYLSLYELLASF